MNKIVIEGFKDAYQTEKWCYKNTDAADLFGVDFEESHGWFVYEKEEGASEWICTPSPYMGDFYMEEGLEQLCAMGEDGWNHPMYDLVLKSYTMCNPDAEVQ